MRLWPAFLLIGGCAGAVGDPVSTGEVGIAAATVGYEAAQTMRCLPAGFERVSPQIVDDRHVTYAWTRSELLVSTLEEACPGLRPTSRLLVRRVGPRLCDGDQFQAIGASAGAVPGPLCRFGPFTRYRRQPL